MSCTVLNDRSTEETNGLYTSFFFVLMMTFPSDKVQNEEMCDFYGSCSEFSQKGLCLCPLGEVFNKP